MNSCFSNSASNNYYDYFFFFIKDRYKVREDRNSETPMTYLMLQPLC